MNEIIPVINVIVFRAVGSLKKVVLANQKTKQLEKISHFERKIQGNLAH